MGHVNFKTLRDMHDKNIVSGLSITQISQQMPFCKGCTYGKQHRESKYPGETFHVDLCGKMSAPSIGGSNYFMLLKDDCTRYCFVYFIKRTTKVLEKLKQFVAEVQDDGHTIKRLRSDGGLEFVVGQKS